MRPHVGLEVTPSIRLVRQLGAGGMGSVWLGHHVGLQTDVAVKFLSADLAASESALLRFTDEASVAAQIKSPHVVQVLDHGLVAEELPFIVMELLHGEDLAVHVARRGPLDLAAAAVLVQQLGQVLSQAHGAGIVHRDVKPENVFLVSGYGELFVKLIDFGIAKWRTRDRSLTVTGHLVGTPDFMCPEQIAHAKDVGSVADLWALAGVTYFSVLGRPPFSRETLPATLLAIEKGEFALPFERYGIGNPALDAFFLRALCREPTGRFASLRELVGTFCQVAEVPLTHTLRLVADDLEGAPDSKSFTRVGRGARATRPDLPPDAQRVRASRAGFAADDEGPRSVSGVTVAYEPPLLRESLEASRAADAEAIDTEPDTPSRLRRARSARARRRVGVWLLVGSCALGGWAVSQEPWRHAWRPGRAVLLEWPAKAVQLIWPEKAAPPLAMPPVRSREEVQPTELLSEQLEETPAPFVTSSVTTQATLLGSAQPSASAPTPGSPRPWLGSARRAKSSVPEVPSTELTQSSDFASPPTTKTKVTAPRTQTRESLKDRGF